MSDFYDPFVQILADELRETDPDAIAGIRRIVEMIGPKRAGELAELAKTVHDTTGMKTWKEKRERTVGGIFFALACRKRYSGMTTEQRKYCYPGIARRANEQRETAKAYAHQP